MRACLTNDFVAEDATEISFNKILIRGPLDGRLNTVHEEVTIFIHIHLLEDVGMVT